MPANRNAPVRREGGAALLVLMLVIVLTVGSMFLQKLSNGSTIAQQRSDRTTQALKEAKATLLAHAVTYGEMHPVNAFPTGSTTEDDVTLPPGTLPCPERSLGVGGEGSETHPCGATDVAAIGRFPWRALGIGALRDGDNECLWYLVSGSFKSNPGPHVLNYDSVGQFRVLDRTGNILVGATPETRAAALIVAPGPPLVGQNRSSVTGTEACGGNYIASNYLDTITIGSTTYNNASPSTAANAVIDIVMGDGATLNDRIIALTPTELFAGIGKRTDLATALYDASDTTGSGATPALAQKLAAMLARYGLKNAAGDHRLPWAAPLALGAFDNDSFDDVAGTYAGRPPFRVGTSRATTGSTLVSSGCSSASDNCRLLIVERATGGGVIDVNWWRVAGKPLDSSGNSTYSSSGGWFARWKDQYFYAVSPEFSPASSVTWVPGSDPCDVDNFPFNTCINVNGQRFAAVIIHAGARLAGQSRTTLAEKTIIANYLEAGNDAAFTPTPVLPLTFTATASDRIVCIRSADLGIESDCNNLP